MIVRSGIVTRRGWLLATLVALVAAGMASPASAAPPSPAAVAAKGAARSAPAWLTQLQRHAVRYTKAGQRGPVGPNPAQALVPRPGRLDWGGWRRQQSAQAPVATSAKTRAKAAARPAEAPAQPLTVREDEPRGTRGSNDTFGSAQRIEGVGSGTGENPGALVLGRLSPEQLPPDAIRAVPPNKEEDGTPETARDTGVSRVRKGIRTTGRIGDAPEPPGQPRPTDVDFYKFTLRAGEQLDFGMRTTSGTLEPTAFLVDASGNLISFSEDTQTTATIKATVRSTGVYYVIATGWTIINIDTGEVIVPNGTYALTASARAGDRDLYALDLRAGDVLGVTVEDAAGYVSVFDRTGTEVHGSPYDATYIYPAQSPLPGGGNATTDHVARTSGTHYVEITSGEGSYQASIEVYRAGGTGERRTQTIYLDTDGQRLNTNVVGGRGVTTLSPLRAFLGRWGIPRARERELVARIKNAVIENLETDLRASGLSDSVDVRVVTNYDTPDPFGEPGVTRLVIGGTIEESGIPTIGIAQSIDPGNFAREETALVLLDSLSEPGSVAQAPYSLNTYMRPSSNRVRFVARAVGNVASHEAGHLIGSWHVDETNAVADLMDAGGNFPLLFGVGPDRVGGTADDPDVDFGVDRFNLFEGFTGKQDALARSVWGMSSRTPV